MNGSDRYLLDTNIIIALFATDAGVIRHLQGAAEVFVPVIAVGELIYGAYRSTHRDDNLLRIDDFIQQSIILSCDLETACGALWRDQRHVKKAGAPDPRERYMDRGVGKTASTYPGQS
jgi:predicted nucleic acid-binding protein